MAITLVQPPEKHPQLTVCLLNYFHVEAAGQVIPSCGPKADALLALLALRRECRAARADVLFGLWPDCDETLAAQNLNSLNSNLKKSLGKYLDGQPPVIAEDGTYRLNIEAGIDIDIACFDALSDNAEHAMRAGTPAARVLIDQALAVYRGNLHTRETSDALMQFERLRTRFLGLLAWAAAWHAESAEWCEATRLAYRMLAEDECREDAHRILMRALAAQGQRTQALRQFQLCAELLRKAFDAQPEQASQLLYERLRSGQASAACECITPLDLPLARPGL
jgi:DNA-binding SARP family transcriptional activator